MVEVFRRRVIKLLVQRELLNDDFARNLPHKGTVERNAVVSGSFLSVRSSGSAPYPGSSRRLRPG
jgi:hypothetical protein